MISLVVFALLHLPSIASSSTLRSHLSDTLRLKCDALPYRTTFDDNLCYFAVLQEMGYSDATKQCSTILPGAKVALSVQASIFNAIMVDRSKFHLDSSSAGSKYAICVYDSEYKCDGSQPIQNAGRCLVRAPKKMTFADAENYCNELGAEIPAPTNDLDNKVVRDALGEEPAWVHKTLLKDNKFTWSQARDYSRWSTCDRTAEPKPILYSGSQNNLWTCSADMASIIDRSGYWGNVGVTNLMDVVCFKNADNIFTKGEATSCDYHEGHNTDASTKANVKISCQNAQFAMVPAPKISSKTCYNLTRVTTRYEVLDKTVVETKRGCEVACDGKEKCIGFSLKETGIYSSCILLASSNSKQLCTVPNAIFLKKTTGCPDVIRTNITAEFGDDPCIDSRHDSVLRLSTKRICPHDKKIPYVIRAIDANGCRITLDNGKWNYIEKVGDMWEYRFAYTNKSNSAVGIIAATCVLAGDKKCTCEPLNHLVKDPKSKSVTIAGHDVANACEKKGAFVQWTDVPKCRGYGTYDFDRRDTPKDNVVCRAGTWILSREYTQNSWAVTGISCFK